ncbi:MAG: hypothetical protein K1X64_16255 [Myxococcaceae bacterium]|nr:hypothetical protein [Myxococcaceae bacterium]
MNKAATAHTQIDLPSALDTELARLWFAALKKEWSSLAVLPAHAQGSAAAVAKGLAKVAAQHRDNAIRLISAEGADVAATSRVIIDLTQHVAHGGVAIVVLDSVLSNPAGIPIAMATDAALLCVELGVADVAAAQKTMEIIGASRFLGAVTHSSKK